ncbi:MAG: hypothetical protein WBH11_10555, partial [Stenotrophomonas geniculata]
SRSSRAWARLYSDLQRFRDDAGAGAHHRSTSKTIRRNMRAIAVIGIALLLNSILDLGEHTAWR